MKSTREKSKVRILLVLDSLDYGGATRVNQDLTHLYKRADFYVLTGINDFFPSLRKEFRCKKFFTFPIWKRSNFTSYLSTLLLTFIRLFQVLKDLDIDVIVLNLPHSAFGVILNPLTWNKKKIFIFHGAWDTERRSLREFFFSRESKRILQPGNLFFEVKNKIEYIIQKVAMQFSSFTVVFSEYSKSLVENYYKVRKERIKKLPPIIDAFNKDFRLSQKSECVSFLVPSRIEPRKGIHLVVEAINLLQNMKTERFEVIFTGPALSENYMLYLIKRCKEMNLFDHVRFTRVFGRKELFALYRKVDCVIMPSVDLETLGMTTLESLSCGTPVIGFNRCATPEILRKVDDRLIVAKLSAKELAKRMKWFANLSNQEREILAKKAMQEFRLFSDRKKLQSYLNELFGFQSARPTIIEPHP